MSWRHGGNSGPSRRLILGHLPRSPAIPLWQHKRPRSHGGTKPAFATDGFAAVRGMCIPMVNT